MDMIITNVTEHGIDVPVAGTDAPLRRVIEEPATPGNPYRKPVVLPEPTQPATPVKAPEREPVPVTATTYGLPENEFD